LQPLALPARGLLSGPVSVQCGFHESPPRRKPEGECFGPRRPRGLHRPDARRRRALVGRVGARPGCRHAQPGRHAPRGRRPPGRRTRPAAGGLPDRAAAARLRGTARRGGRRAHGPHRRRRARDPDAGA